MKHRFSWAIVALLLSLCAQAQETYRYAVKDSSELYLDIFRPDSNAQTTFKDTFSVYCLLFFNPQSLTIT